MSTENHLYYGDNLSTMSKLPSKCIDLIYLDPPFNSASDYISAYDSNNERSTHEAFTDKWRWNTEYQAIYEHISADYLAQKNDTHRHAIEGLHRLLGEGSMLSYLLYIYVRLIEMRRLLKTNGSIYLHCDPTSSHYLKILLDVVFGAPQFRNEIVWHYTGGGRSKRYFSRKHDTIFYYGSKNVPFYLDRVRVPYKSESGYAKSGIVSRKGKRYLPHPDGTPVDDVWEIPMVNPMSRERLGYATQKPFKLLERIILASSSEGDTVMDPFCGCGTTLDVAESLNRKWIGIDTSYLAVETTTHRLRDRYTDHIKSTYKVHGTPTNLKEARNLLRSTVYAASKAKLRGSEEASTMVKCAEQLESQYNKETGRFEFQRWVCGLLGAMPNDRAIGQSGIDGKLKWSSFSDNEYVVGAVEVSCAQEFSLDELTALGALLNNHYVCGILVTLYKAETEAIRFICDSASTWTYYTGVQYPKLQVYSIEEHFEGIKAQMPPPIRPYKRAVLAER